MSFDQPEYIAITIDESEDFEPNPPIIQSSEVIIEPFVSKTLDIIPYDNNTTVLTFCMVKKNDPHNPIPMSETNNTYIILKICNFYNSEFKDQILWEILDGLQLIFESQHNYSNSSYYHDVFDSLIKPEPEEPFYIKKHGKYSYYDDFDEYYLLFSINYTPTIIQDDGDKQIVFKWA